MAIRTIPLSLQLTLDEVIVAAKGAGVDGKGLYEVIDVFDAVFIWKDIFGELVSLEHRDDGNDPPDVVAVFTDGRRMDFEHTRIDPRHRKHAEAVRNDVDPQHKSFTNVLPISKPTHDRGEIVQQLFTPGGLFEPVADSNQCWAQNIVTAILTKNEKFSSGGILLMKTDECFFNLSFRTTINEAFEAARSAADLSRWECFLLSHWNSVSWISARNTAGGTEWRSSH